MNGETVSGDAEKGKASAWPSDDPANFYLEAEHMVQRDTFSGFCIATADRLKHESLFLHYLIEPRHQCWELPPRGWPPVGGGKCFGQ